MKRQIIKINEKKCNGCGSCIPNCPEGAIQIIDGKARLIGDLFCDGLGACIGECPQNAISIEEREAEPYNEEKVMLENIIPKEINTIKAHLKHLKEHGENKLLKIAVNVLKQKNIKLDFSEYIQLEMTRDTENKLPCGCPGTMSKSLQKKNFINSTKEKIQSHLSQWPIQLKLINPNASYLENANLLIAADCTAFAYGDFHRDYIKDKITIIFCPKLDHEIELYIDKLSEIFSNKNIKSITIARMQVPCCGGVETIINKALEKSGKNIKLSSNIIKIG